MLIVNLEQLTTHDDINPTTVASWASNLHSATFDPYEIPESSTNLIQTIAISVISAAQSMRLTDYGSLEGVVQGADAVMSVRQISSKSASNFSASTGISINIVQRFKEIVISKSFR